ncbi:Asp-tRNA(Asn)/Glu-tRNA(Gln) amidotransferase GatCAB subunit C [Candidatus Woesearchaeota archaeon CG10_big_fil_rev_8_21_14_0_10_37_12]|nr:MAG: Asp-tRNA(Asn)/Glu-tRNA(Gln) amidotransferase GatCAB subunit C [Candidatus Woesearchaeota archaeon CG10_big_fil_rev_8_21_14_0_10_37_12]
MEITPELVKHVAQTARLNLKEEELKKYAAEMQEILNTFEKLSEVDTTGVEPSFHPIPIKNITRKDEPNDCLPREKILELTKHKTNEHFKGPKVL